MVPNTQTDLKRMVVNKLLLCGHLEQDVIKIQYVTNPMIDLYDHQVILIYFSRWMHSNHFYTLAFVQNSFAR